MLNDNAQLARVYPHAWQVTGNEFFRIITEEILDYVMREMLDPAGGFYSNGGESDTFMAAFGVTRHGSFEVPVPG